MADISRKHQSLTVTPRRSSIIRIGSEAPSKPDARRRKSIDQPATATDAAHRLTAAAFATTQTLVTSGRSSGLRFLQFVRAYMKGFAAGLATFWLLTELSGGSFNPVSAIAMHVVAIVVAPFYALMLAPAFFGLYRSTAMVGLTGHARAYLIGGGGGGLLLLQRLASGQLIIGGDLRADLFAISSLIAGLVGAMTFNRAADTIVLANHRPS